MRDKPANLTKSEKDDVLSSLMRLKAVEFGTIPNADASTASSQVVSLEKPIVKPTKPLSSDDLKRLAHC